MQNNWLKTFLVSFILNFNIILILIFAPLFARAQVDTDEAALDVIELEVKKAEIKKIENKNSESSALDNAVKSASSDPNKDVISTEGSINQNKLDEQNKNKNQDQNQNQTQTQNENSPLIQEKKIEYLSDLKTLQPFSEISVLQKRYMPKGGRFQIFGGYSMIVNDPWNITNGWNFRLGFGLTESWAIEGVTSILNGSASQFSSDLMAQHGIRSKTFGSAVGGNILNLVWTPIYGKLAYSNQKIVPFDMYFLIGGGSTSIESENSLTRITTINAYQTISMGTGQIYAITRSVGFRWDLTLNSTTAPNVTLNNLILTMGANWYFPEAKYR